ncbi:hypothetical protein K7432_000776 [Basidiobolus ranarum]|uniref:Uncharacterized protein n=1 Tax=Basidiobolus ranarum TaxID=34480 RepID=A0ABR2WAR1_9FUNG
MHLPIPTPKATLSISYLCLALGLFRGVYSEEKNNQDSEIDEEQIGQALELARALLNSQEASKLGTSDRKVSSQYPNPNIDLIQNLLKGLTGNPNLDSGDDLNLPGNNQLIENERDIYPYRESSGSTYQFPRQSQSSTNKPGLYYPKTSIYQYGEGPSQSIFQSSDPSYAKSYQSGGMYKPLRDNGYLMPGYRDPRDKPNTEEASSSRLVQSIATLRQEVRRLRLNNRLAKQTVDELQKATKDIGELRVLMTQMFIKGKVSKKFSPTPTPKLKPKSPKPAKTPKVPNTYTNSDVASYYKNGGMKDFDMYSTLSDIAQVPKEVPTTANITSLPLELRNAVNMTNLKSTPDGYLIGDGFAYKNGYWYKDGYWYKNGFYWENGKWYNDKIEIAPQSNCNSTLPCLLGNPPPVPSSLQ